MIVAARAKSSVSAVQRESFSQNGYSSEQWATRTRSSCDTAAKGSVAFMARLSSAAGSGNVEVASRTSVTERRACDFVSPSILGGRDPGVVGQRRKLERCQFTVDVGVQHTTPVIFSK